MAQTKKIECHQIASYHPEQYLQFRSRQFRYRPDDAAALRHLIGFLRSERVILAEKVSVPQVTEVKRLTQAYKQYLREARNLAEPTIAYYVPFIRHFLNDRFGNGAVTLSHLSARDVVRFVQRQASRLHRGERS